MSDYKPLDDRQVINRAALPNIGTPAGDNLADILAAINNVLGSVSSGGGYYAKKATLTSGATSQVVTIPTQQDTSYIVLAMMGNLVDSFPQYQQVEVTAKSPTGFTFSWNHPLDSSNYFVSYIVPFKTFPEAESAIGSGADTLSSSLFMPQTGSNYPVIAQIQNLVDPHPEFQTVVVGANNTTTVNFSFNTLTDSANYEMVYGILATGQVALASGVTSATLPLPVNFNSSGYTLIATMQNTSDSFPQYQPILLSGQTGTSATVSWNIPTDVSSYILTYYAISLTA
jgi:hypothetical protein